MKLTHGSLFSGIGGFDLGFERAGIKTIWQVEIDDYCRRVLARHFPSAQRYDDVRTVGKHNLTPVDIISGGFPCQDISNAGKRAGIDGERSGLWSEYARIIGELRPRFVVVENVAALLDGGMGRVLGDLAAIGYDAEWETICACEFGAAHTRPRVFIVAYANGERLQGCSAEQQKVFRGIAELSAIRNASAGRWKEQLPSPVFCRGIDGIPDKSHRLRGLGNAIVPQIAEWIGRRLAEPGGAT